MPSHARRYLIPSGQGWTGGHVGGTLRADGGRKPWVVVFTKGGSIDKTRSFKNRERAKTWRREYSNETGRTNNRWRFHPEDPSKVEMVVGPAHIVIYDADKHDLFTSYMWNIDPRSNRVYTTARIVANKAGLNGEKREKREENTNMATLSMVNLLVGDTVRTPRHLVRPDNGVVNNCLNNIVPMSTMQKGRTRGKYGAGVKQPNKEKKKKKNQAKRNMKKKKH